jgi:uncharacterized protein YdeI (YjbR/CyaY-like superfamily)
VSPLADAPEVFAEDRATWRRWLEAHHAASGGAWLVTWRSRSGRQGLPYEDAVEEALCFGWVDKQRRRVDDQRTSLLVTPRRPGSHWGRPNRERVERLEREGKLEPAGRAAIEDAKAAGTWDSDGA